MVLSCDAISRDTPSPGCASSPSNGPRDPLERAVVSWEGPGQPIMLTLYGAEGQVAVLLLPKGALTLAQEPLTRGVQAIKVDWPG